MNRDHAFSLRPLPYLVVFLTLVLGAGPALALPRDPDKGGSREKPLEQAREESAVKDRPRSSFDLPAGELRIASPEVLAANGQKIELSVSLDRDVDDATLELTLPKRWLGRSGVSGVARSRAPGEGRVSGARGRTRRADRVVSFDFTGAKKGDVARFEVTDVGIAAGTYKLPYRWRGPSGGAAQGVATVVFYAPARGSESESNAPDFSRLANPGFAVNATDDAAEESETFLTAVPGNKLRFVVGANGGGFNAWITNDGGQTFTKASMPVATDAPGEASPETSNPCCDPMSAADAAGNVWYGGLSRPNGAGNPSRIVINRFAPGSSTFQAQTTGLPVRTAGTQDKPMMTIDNSSSSPAFGRLYVVWNEPAAGGGINVVISQCDTRPGGTLNAAACDNSDNWSTPVSVTRASGNYIYADVAVGPDGKAYVVWWDYSATNAIRGDVCDPASQNCKAAAGWGTPSTIATLDATGGTPVPFECPILAQPGGRASTSSQVDVDRSGGTRNGQVYVTWGDLRPESGTTKCSRSTTPAATHLSWDSFVASAAGALPGGASPSASVATRLITDGEGGGQGNSDDWFPWLAVDQSTGQAWADLYSTRDDATRKTTNFYVRTVTPAAGGAHTLGALNRVSGSPSDYSASPCCNFGSDYGDYTGIDATQGIALPVWSDKRGGQDGEAFSFAEARASLALDSQTVDDSAAAGGDGDGVLEPGESFRLTERLRNQGHAPATGVSSTLTESLPALTLTQPTSAYPDIPPGATASNATPFAGTLSAAADCGASLSMTLQTTTAQGPFNVPVSVPTGVPGSVQSFTATPAAAIPDNNPTGVSSNLAVSGVGALSDLDVRLNITHPFDGQLTVTLHSPTGTTIPLVQNRGGSGDDFAGTVLDDEAASSIAAGTAPFKGSFRPEQPLSSFDVASANGTWTLTVVDNASQSTGSLASWGLDARGSTCSGSGTGPAPGPIAGLTASPGPESVALDWDDTASATSYEVFRRNPDGTTYPATPTASPSPSRFTDVGRTAGSQYCYKVRAVNSNGPGPLSSEACATAAPQPQPPPQPQLPQPQLPGAITGLSAVGSAQGVGLFWDDTPTATRYYVFRKVGLGYPPLPTATVTPSEFADLGRAAGVRECYRVQAVNGNGAGPLSNEVCAAPLGGEPQQPPKPVLDLSGAPPSVRVDSKGRFSYRFKGTPNAAGSLTMTTIKAVTIAAGGKRKLVLTRKSFRVPASGQVRVRLKLGSTARRTLNRARTLRAGTTVKLGTLTPKRNITLKAPRAKQKKRP